MRNFVERRGQNLSAPPFLSLFLPSPRSKSKDSSGCGCWAVTPQILKNYVSHLAHFGGKIVALQFPVTKTIFC